MEDKKYFWLKLKRDFFKRHDIEIIESMPNGEKYVLFYLKLLTESIDHEGRLRFSDTIPYKDTMLATITRTDIDIVRSAIKIFTELKMMEIFDDDTLYMSQIEDMLGSATVWAEKKRVYRDNQKQIEDKTSEGQSGGQKEDMSDKSKSKRLDIEKDIELDSEIEKEEDKIENLSFEEKKVYPENKKEYLPEFLKVWAKIERAGIFTLQLYRKNSDSTPVSEGLTTQEMMLSLLNRTFVEDWFVNVSEKQRINLPHLQDMSWERLVSICSISAIKDRIHEPKLKDFLLNMHNTKRTNYSQFLSWTGPQFGAAPSNCNTNTPNVTMPNPGTDDLPPNILKAYKNVCSFQAPNFKVKDKNTLIKHLFSIDKWVREGYLYLDRANYGKNSQFYGSVAGIVDVILNEMVAKWTKTIDEGFFEVGGHWWPKYVGMAEKEGVIMSVGPIQRKTIDVDIQIEEMRRK